MVFFFFYKGGGGDLVHMPTVSSHLFCPGELQNQGVQDVFVFCTRGELHKYRVPSLLETYRQQGLVVHHLPFPDGGTPELQQCCQILEGLQANLNNNRKTVIQ